jgi:hypothetical protein
MRRFNTGKTHLLDDGIKERRFKDEEEKLSFQSIRDEFDARLRPKRDETHSSSLNGEIRSVAQLWVERVEVVQERGQESVSMVEKEMNQWRAIVRSNGGEEQECSIVPFDASLRKPADDSCQTTTSSLSSPFPLNTSFPLLLPFEPLSVWDVDWSCDDDGLEEEEEEGTGGTRDGSEYWDEKGRCQDLKKSAMRWMQSWGMIQSLQEGVKWVKSCERERNPSRTFSLQWVGFLPWKKPQHWRQKRKIAYTASWKVLMRPWNHLADALWTEF